MSSIKFNFSNIRFIEVDINKPFLSYFFVDLFHKKELVGTNLPAVRIKLGLDDLQHLIPFDRKIKGSIASVKSLEDGAGLAELANQIVTFTEGYLKKKEGTLKLHKMSLLHFSKLYLPLLVKEVIVLDPDANRPNSIISILRVVRINHGKWNYAQDQIDITVSLPELKQLTAQRRLKYLIDQVKSIDIASSREIKSIQKEILLLVSSEFQDHQLDFSIG